MKAHARGLRLLAISLFCGASLTQNALASSDQQDAEYSCHQGQRTRHYWCCQSGEGSKSWSGDQSTCGPNVYVNWNNCYSLFGNPTRGECTVNQDLQLPTEP